MTVIAMTLMRSDEYLIKFAEKRMERYMLTADKTVQKISDNYKKALDELIKPFESIYKGVTVGISVVEAKRILNVIDKSDIDGFFSKAVERISDTDTKELMQSEFEKPAIKAKVHQIKTLVNKIKFICRDVSSKTTELTSNCLDEIIEEAYYHSAYDVQRSTGIGMFLPLLSEEQIDEIRLTNWSGVQYPDRIKNNGIRLSDVLIAEVLSGFLTKKNQHRMSEIIAQRMSEAFNRSYTLLRTESDFVANQAELQSYKEHSIKRYRYIAVLDLRTSKMCRELDGKEFDVDKAIIGINFPPLHPHCRSITRPVIDGEDISLMERNATDPETGENMTVPADMTYKEWYDYFVKNNSECESKEKIIKNYISDKKQFERYSKLLGEDFPKSFNEFQHIKYHDPNEYGIIKAQAKGMGYYNKAIKNEHEITKQVEEIASDVDFNVTGFDYRIKSKESYLRKIRTNYSERGNKYEINDIIRYTYTSSPESMVIKTQTAIEKLEEKSYNTVKVKNYWLDDTNPYNGINTIVQTPKGQKFEIQYHTQESFDLKNGKMHELYEKQRLINDKRSIEYIELRNQMFDLSDSLKVPDDIERVKNKI